MYSEEHFMDDHAIGAYCPHESKSVPEQSHFCGIIEAEPIHGVKNRGNNDDDMTDPPEELLVLDHSLHTLLEGLRRGIRAGGDSSALCGRHCDVNGGRRRLKRRQEIVRKGKAVEKKEEVGDDVARHSGVNWLWLAGLGEYKNRSADVISRKKTNFGILANKV
jgi:hypothetical protein